MVFRQLDEWTKEHNRIPKATDPAESDMPMPEASTVQKLFDMNSSTFLNMYYPAYKKKKPISKYAMQYCLKLACIKYIILAAWL